MRVAARAAGLDVAGPSAAELGATQGAASEGMSDMGGDLRESRIRPSPPDALSSLGRLGESPACLSLSRGARVHRFLADDDDFAYLTFILQDRKSTRLNSSHSC